jgi:hypothetical protein
MTEQKFDDLSAWLRAQFQHLRRSIGQQFRHLHRQ